MSSSETTALVMVNPAWPLAAVGRSRNRAVVALGNGSHGQHGAPQQQEVRLTDEEVTELNLEAGRTQGR